MRRLACCRASFCRLAYSPSACAGAGCGTSSRRVSQGVTHRQALEPKQQPSRPAADTRAYVAPMALVAMGTFADMDTHLALDSSPCCVMRPRRSMVENAILGHRIEKQVDERTRRTSSYQRASPCPGPEEERAVLGPPLPDGTLAWQRSGVSRHCPSLQGTAAEVCYRT